MKAYQLGDVITFRHWPLSAQMPDRHLPPEGVVVEARNYTGTVVNLGTGRGGVILGYEVAVHDWEELGFPGPQHYVHTDEVVRPDLDQLVLFEPPAVLLSRAEAMQADRVRVALDDGTEHVGRLLTWTPSHLQLDLGDRRVRWPTFSLRGVYVA